MTKRVVSFLGKNRVTSSPTAPGDTNPSDASDEDICKTREPRRNTVEMYSSAILAFTNLDTHDLDL